MVLVDASVWIRYFMNRMPYAAEFDSLLASGEVSGHDLVYGELLMGDTGGRQRYLKSYEFIDRAPLVPHHDVVMFVRTRKLHGRGIGWIDAHLLASALASGIPLWTADERLLAIARELDIAHETGAA